MLEVFVRSSIRARAAPALGKIGTEAADFASEDWEAL
jgi:hypothetical protein